MKSSVKTIKASLRTKDVDKVQVDFIGGVFTPTEFTSVFMAILETYTVGLLGTNTPEQVFDHFNRIFGIFLNKIVPEKRHYELSKEHKEFKEKVDDTLGRPLSLEEIKENENARFSAYLLCRDILVKEIGLTEESADIILNKRLNLEEVIVKKDAEKEKRK